MDDTQVVLATINDAFRRQGAITVTRGVYDVSDFFGLLQAVRQYDGFNADNDPYGEHDFGKLDWHGDRVLWKIDYYDESYEYWCDPLGPDCHRVLTVMLASEY